MRLRNVWWEEEGLLYVMSYADIYFFLPGLPSAVLYISIADFI